MLPAENALLPNLVSEDLLVSANALISISSNTSRLAGAALGGLLLGLAGLSGVTLLDVLSFLFVSAMVVLITIPAKSTPPKEEVPAAATATWKHLVIEWLEGAAIDLPRTHAYHSPHRLYTHRFRGRNLRRTPCCLRQAGIGRRCSSLRHTPRSTSCRQLDRRSGHWPNWKSHTAIAPGRFRSVRLRLHRSSHYRYTHLCAWSADRLSPLHSGWAARHRLSRRDSMHPFRPSWKTKCEDVSSGHFWQ